MDLDRLRKLTLDAERTAMPRTQGLPSLTDKVAAQRAEIDALRRGLWDAIAEIERLQMLMADYG